MVQSSVADEDFHSTLIIFQILLSSQVHVFIFKIVAKQFTDTIHGHLVLKHILLEKNGATDQAPHAVVVNPIEEIFLLLGPLFCFKKFLYHVVSQTWRTFEYRLKALVKINLPVGRLSIFSNKVKLIFSSVVQSLSQYLHAR